jgi:hypothetical protein
MARKGEDLAPGMPNPSRRKATGKAPPFFARMSEALEGVPSSALPQLHRSALPQLHRHVLLTLAGFANPDGGECFPKVATVALRVGVARPRVCLVLRELEAARWIGRRARFLPGSGGQTSTIYTLALNGGPIVRQPRKRPGRATGFNRPVSKAERDAAGVLDLAAKRAERKAATDK